MKRYIKPEIEIIMFAVEDVITTSAPIEPIEGEVIFPSTPESGVF